MSVALDLIFMGLFFVASLWGFYQKMQLDTISNVMGKSFIKAVTSGKPGIMVAEIKEHLVEFNYYPSTRMDENGYYAIPIKSSDGDTIIGHRKIPKDDVFFLNGKRPIAFILHNKIRSFNPEQIKVLDTADMTGSLTELIKDYSYYTTLDIANKSLASRMKLTSDPAQLDELRKQYEENAMLMKAIEAKWGVIIARLKKGEDVIIHDKDSDEVHLVRPINFAKFAEATTGASPTEIGKLATDMYKRWSTKFIEDIIKVFRIPGLNQKSTSAFGGMTLLLGMLVLVGLIAMLVVLRGGG